MNLFRRKVFRDFTIGTVSELALFALLTWLEAPLSGASANPARSFGPEVVSRLWEGWWIYWLGPCLGAALAVLLLRNDLLKHLRPVEARLCHFGHHGATGKRRREVK
jgi:hypothetical protein